MNLKEAFETIQKAMADSEKYSGDRAEVHITNTQINLWANDERMESFEKASEAAAELLIS